jgi:putative ABC transport system substrate-binding protein
MEAVLGLEKAMRRRDFIAGIAGSAAAWPLVARAQQNVRRIGVLMTLPENSQEGQAWITAFRDGLQKVGWSESRNIRIDARWGATDAASPRLASEIIANHPDLILAQNTPTTLALLQLTTTIPIVFANVADPVGSGLVASLPHPGGNVTGFINIEGSMSGKWLELLREMVPDVNRVVFLFNPATAPYFDYYLKPFKDAARSFAIEAAAASVHDRAELESAISAHAQQPNSGLMVMPDGFNINHRREITSLAARYRFPAVYPQRIYPEVGGLLSYGNDPLDNFRRAANYADRILRGSKPGELPVQVPVKFELVLNLKTAKALGLDIPATVLARADEVIE